MKDIRDNKRFPALHEVCVPVRTFHPHAVRVFHGAKTMNSTKKTAGKTATTGKRRQGWRDTRRKGERVIIDPAGRVIHGTARDVREAALTPERRNDLAESLRLARYLHGEKTIDAAEFRDMCEDRRRGAIMSGVALERVIPPSVRVSPAMFIKLQAGARMLGYTWSEWLDQLWSGELEALLDYAESETGKRELPFTRQERAALARLEAAAL